MVQLGRRNYTERLKNGSHNMADLLAHLGDLFVDLFACVLDLFLSSQEDQNIARRLADMYLHHSSDGGLQVIPLRFLSRRCQKCGRGWISHADHQGRKGLILQAASPYTSHVPVLCRRTCV